MRHRSAWIASPIAPRFGDKNRRFAVVDVVVSPDVAEDLNIDVGGTTKQLPTLALFIGGRYGVKSPCGARARRSFTTVRPPQ